jgi:hypothetical protein
LALFRILCQNSLQVLNEDSLYSFISTRPSVDPESFRLFQFVRFECVSCDCIRDFVLHIAVSVDYRLWESVLQRLTASIISPPTLFTTFSPSESHKERNRPFSVSRPLTESIHISPENTAEMFTTKGLSQLLQNRFILVLSGMPLISAPTVRLKGRTRSLDLLGFPRNGLHPTAYAIRSGRLRSWVVGSLLDFMNWT